MTSASKDTGSEQSTKVRTRIRNTAADLFARHSYPTTSMTEIARVSGVSKSLIYHYYQDKAALLYDISNSHVQSLLRLVKESEQMSFSEPVKELQYLITRFMKEYETASNYHTVLVQDLKFLPTSQGEVVLRAQRRIVDHFTKVVLATNCDLVANDKVVARTLTMLLFGMMNWTFTWLDPNGTFSFAQVGEIVERVFLSAITTAPGLKINQEERY
jgi:AcrR family transcriptional regulator